VKDIFIFKNIIIILKIELRRIKGYGRYNLGNEIRFLLDRNKIPFRYCPAFDFEDKNKIINDFNMKNNNINKEIKTKKIK